MLDASGDSLQDSGSSKPSTAESTSSHSNREPVDSGQSSEHEPSTTDITSSDGVEEQETSRTPSEQKSRTVERPSSDSSGEKEASGKSPEHMAGTDACSNHQRGSKITAVTVGAGFNALPARGVDLCSDSCMSYASLATF